MNTIMIIDNDKSFSKYIAELIHHEGFETFELSTIEDGFKQLSVHKCSLLIYAVDLPENNGWKFIEKVKLAHPSLPVIVISNQKNIELAADAIKKGALDYFSKPPDVNRFLVSVRNALMSNQSVNGIIKYRQKSGKMQHIVGISDSIKRINEMIEIVAPTDARVLITGKNGVGKELIAKWIHEKSNRNEGPMVEVNCAAIPNELIESELFGHEKGAFTSALKQHSGKFEQANGGTLFLDEIGDMSLSAQAKVLRVLQEKKISRVGSDRTIPIDVRVITATNKDLIKECRLNHFRLDLYHRIAVIIINVPSLNERAEDIPVLIDYFLEQLSDEYGWPLKPIEPQAVFALQQHYWSGNIRELKNVVERLLILSGEIITLTDVVNFVSPEFNLDRV